MQESSKLPKAKKAKSVKSAGEVDKGLYKGARSERFLYQKLQEHLTKDDAFRWNIVKEFEQ